ncbi:acetolactate synthase small subunit [Microbacterium endophyticum]|uniref:Acetolactate synthase small subunit n=1 Tax=Microbacterium endophyticum TaxID=1526412 RepID=A0A7W4V3G2_9MICO|nr:hypothetical protein [Microbacterium endophyticum]MBB2975590.1 acetolactate synthase small subunit [Microbacterium endophyticum]NIK35391.1 acetolactate synthase small subunit [Microbacterium endophyticum]
MTTDINDRWVAFVTVADRSGTVTALANMFSTRGVSFESFHTLSVRDGVGRMSITFRGSERLSRVLVRTLERLDVVRSVQLENTGDERVRAIAVLGSSVIIGPFADVESQLDDALAEGETLVAFTVLPPE